MDTPHNIAKGPKEALPPRAPSTGVQTPSPQANGGPTKAENGRPVLYPVRLRVNIYEVMAASLQRVCKRWGIPEGIGARIAITQFLAQQDPQYRAE